MSEYPTAEEELKTMTKRFWAQVEATEEVVRERDQYREALDRIARPIWWMQEDAKRDGCKINGAMAATLADSGNYLRSIAEKALSLENADGEARSAAELHPPSCSPDLLLREYDLLLAARDKWRMSQIESIPESLNPEYRLLRTDRDVESSRNTPKYCPCCNRSLNSSSSGHTI